MASARAEWLSGLAPRFWNRRYAAAGLVCLVVFTLEVGRLGRPHSGFSTLIRFGDHFAARRLPQLKDLPLFTYPADGYDGQFYAQLAVAGNPFDPGLRQALDSPAYRERRLLVPLLAHLLGLGRPWLVIQIYALLNVASLWLLAALLARWWFPLTDLHNFIRWVGTLFGAGTIVSVTSALVDGPALLLIAVALREVELDHRWRAALWLALAALARETSLLAVVVFWSPDALDWRGIRRAALATAVAAAPALLWMACLTRHYGDFGGTRNFALPLAGLTAKWHEIAVHARAHGADAATVGEILAVVASVVQVAFIAARPRPRVPWWRLGAAWAVLWAALGAAIWESFPSAAGRALLPLVLAFNRLVPRTRLGLALLVAGNLTVLSAGRIVDGAEPGEQTLFADGVRASYGPGFYGVEHRGRRSWHWARGAAATLTLENPNPGSRSVSVDFGLTSVVARDVTAQVAGAPQAERRWALPPKHLLRFQLGPLALPPGPTTITFSTDAPPWAEVVTTHRPLSFSLDDLYLTVAPAPRP